METEVKLAFPNKEELMGIIEAEWFSDYCLDANGSNTSLLENTYYDTSSNTLRDKGASYRVRIFERDDRIIYEHTVKYGGQVVNGLHQRYEWNAVMPSEKVDIPLFIQKSESSDDPSELLCEVLGGISSEDLEPLCSNRFTRTVYTFGFGDSIMEACFDYGTIYAGEKSSQICELELELESGDVVDLKEMGQFISDNTSGVPLDKSKFLRCLELLNNEDKI